jgi:hypothetical protein
MHLVRSGIAVAAGLMVFSIVFAVLGPGLGAILTTAAAGLMAGYLTAKIAGARELTHGGAAAGLVAASLLAQPAFAFGIRIVVAALAVIAISAGAWIRANATMHGPEQISAEGHPQGTGGEERS